MDLKLVEAVFSMLAFNRKDTYITAKTTNLFTTFSIFITSFNILEPLLVIIEYVPYGDLLGYLRKSRGLYDTYYKDPDVKPQTTLTSQQLMTFSWQVADGMRYLSSRNVSSFGI